MQKNSLSPKRKKWAFALVTASVPLLLLATLELVLRLVNYGPDLSLFVTEHISGKDYLVMNPAVKSRYFSTVEFNPTSGSDYFLSPKPQGTIRIFCLGGSTTVGFPFGEAGSFPAFLHQRLQAIFPDRRVDVINLGMTATNSFTVNDLARELRKYEPDLLVVYDGHNEYYGALGVASRESAGQARWLVRLYLRAIHLKTFLLLRHAVALLRSAPETPAGTGGTMMERLARNQMVPLGSDTYNRGVESFRENLEELSGIAASLGTPVIIGTQVSNLRDLPPLDGQPDDTTGNGFTFSGNFHAALAQLQAARSRNPVSATLAYRQARMLDTLGRWNEADSLYEAARDLDRVRFRAISDLNTVIRLADSLPNIAVADCERKFRANSPNGLIGNNLILEHVHPTLRGNYLLAKEYVATMEREQILTSAKDWFFRDTLSDRQAWDLRTVTPIDEDFAARRIHALTSAWPFRTAAPLPADTLPGPLREIVSRMLSGAMTWEEAHVAAAGIYRKLNDAPGYEREMLALKRYLPANISSYLLLGEFYYQTARFPECWNVLQESLPIEMTRFALTTLGAIGLQYRNPDTAYYFLTRAEPMCKTIEEKLQNSYLLGAAYAGKGDTTSARIKLENVLKINPGFAPARRLLEQMLQPR
jgi:tetratricopeptide (TPR) repeat protein